MKVKIKVEEKDLEFEIGDLDSLIKEHIEDEIKNAIKARLYKLNKFNLIIAQCLTDLEEKFGEPK